MRLSWKDPVEQWDWELKLGPLELVPGMLVLVGLGELVVLEGPEA